jgi:hypothetical protein
MNARKLDAPIESKRITKEKTNKIEVREKTDKLTATRNWDASIDRKLADHNKRIGSSRM